MREGGVPVVIMHIRNAFSYAGSILAVSGSMASLLFAQAGAEVPVPPEIAQVAGKVAPAAAATANASTAALMVAFSGLATALGPQLYAMLKLYLDERREERKAKLERHDLRDQLQAAHSKVDWLETLVEDNRKLIELLARRENLPSVAHPDPPGEFRAALERSAGAADAPKPDAPAP